MHLYIKLKINNLKNSPSSQKPQKADLETSRLFFRRF